MPRSRLGLRVGCFSRPFCSTCPAEQLLHPGPQDQERNHDKPAANAEQPTKQATQKTDRDEARPVGYSLGRGGVSGWFNTTEW